MPILRRLFGADRGIEGLDHGESRSIGRFEVVPADLFVTEATVLDLMARSREPRVTVLPTVEECGAT